MKDEVSKKTVDKGWQAMRQALDREMPQQEKRRPVFWWWLALLGLPLALYTAYSLTTSERPELQLPEKQLPVPIAEHPNAMPSNLAPIMEKPLDPINSHARAGSMPEARSSVATTREIPHSKSADEPLDKTDKAVKLPVENIENEQIGQITIDKTSPDDRRISMDFIPGIAPLPCSMLAKPWKQPALALAAPAEKIARKKPWAFGLGLSAQTAKFKKMDSYGAGLSIEWRPLSHFSFRSGLAYSRHLGEVASASRVVLDAQNYLATADTSNVIIKDKTTNAVVGALEYTNVALPNYVSIPVKFDERLEVPLIVDWQAWKFLHLQVGASVSYITRLKISKIGESGKWTIDASGDRAYSQVEQLAINQIDRWKYNLTGGLAIRLNSHLEIACGMKFPVFTKNTTQDSKTFSPNGADAQYFSTVKPRSFFNLGATYFL